MNTTSDSGDWTIEFNIDNVPQPLRLHIEGEALVGLRDPGQIDFVGLDLTPYKGLELGVSREHAVIRLKGDNLLLSDLSSANGTLLNGRRLESAQEYTLNDGDQLVLGHLKTQIHLNNNVGWSTIRGQRVELSLRYPPIKGRGQQILVVEDEISFGDLYRLTFEQAGYTV